MRVTIIEMAEQKFPGTPNPGDIQSQGPIPTLDSFASRVVDSSINGVYIYDLKLGKHLYINERGTDLTGYTLEDLNRMDEAGFQELFHPEDGPRVVEHMGLIASGADDMRELEYRFKTKDGRWIWCLSRERIFARDDDGSVSQMIGNFLDITDRKKMEEELRQSRSHLSWVLKRVGIGLWCDELPSGRKNWDALTKHLFFVPPDEEPTMEIFWSRLHPDDREATRSALDGALRHGAMYAINHRAVNPRTGEIRWIRSMGQATFAEDGTPTRFDGINFDITERKQAEEQLRRSERQFRQLADAMPQLVWTASPDGRIEYFNERRKDYSGMEVVSGAIPRWRPFLHEDDGLATKEAWRRAVRAGEIYQKEHRVRLADGGFHWHLTRAVPVRDQKGEVVKWFGTTTDIDQVKRTEEALWKLTASQEQTIAERTKLAEDRTRKLQALAVELIEAEEREKRRFSELLHEDLQQMLAAALLQLQSNRKDRPDRIQKNVERLIAESIAKSRRLSHELSPPMLHHLDLTAALEWVAEQMGEQFGLKVELHAAAKKRVEFEPFKMFLFRAARELLFNVFKHAETKSARIELSDSMDRIVLVVGDQGKGFDPEISQSAAVKDGLGLLSIRERAQYLGGDLKIESALGKGSRLTLTLPLQLADSAEKERSASEAGRKSPSSVRPEDFKGEKPIRVLFVDDHKVMRQGLIKLIAAQPQIEPAGEAANGREAVDQALLLEPDLILMDVSMPEMDGIEATRRIREKLPGVRIIGLSMYEDPQIALSMRKAGAEAFLSKTAEPAELLKAIYGLER